MDKNSLISRVTCSVVITVGAGNRKSLSRVTLRVGIVVAIVRIALARAGTKSSQQSPR